MGIVTDQCQLCDIGNLSAQYDAYFKRHVSLGDRTFLLSNLGCILWFLGLDGTFSESNHTLRSRRLSVKCVCQGQVPRLYN